MARRVYNTISKGSVIPTLGFSGKVRAMVRHLTLNLLSRIDKSVDHKFLRCLYCHNVFDDQIQKFENFIVASKRIGTFIDTDTCLEMVRGKKNK